MPLSPEKNVVIVIVGPTGVGKTRMGVRLAQEMAVEIVSADSRQVYRGMDIGTAKPPGDLLRRIPHHFIDTLNPDQSFSAGQFGSEGRKVIEEILGRGNVPLVLGGSGLYIKALLEGFFGDDVRDESIRESLERRLKQEGSTALFRDLEKLDPTAAKKIHPNNTHRILRALEVYLASGTRLSDLHKNKLPAPAFRPLKFGLSKKRPALYADINKRVDQMIQEGLLSEVARLLDQGYEKNLNSLNSVGYKEVIEYLDGRLSFEECVELIKRNSRRYAKRQLTWFRADPEIRWLNLNGDEEFDTAVLAIRRAYRKAVGTEK